MTPGSRPGVEGDVKRPRPDNQNPRQPRLKVHLHEVRVGGRDLRVVRLRPGTRVAFSTNRFHETWHVVSDQVGSALLARLLWGLAYQRQAGTLVVIDGEFIHPTPFDAERSDPILLCNTDLALPSTKVLKALRARLERPTARRTIRWQSVGLDLTRGRAYGGLVREGLLPAWHDPAQKRETMARRGGFVCYAAPPIVLRRTARVVDRLDPKRYGMDYVFLVDSKQSYGVDGEVQVFQDYTRKRSIARQARQEVLAAQTPADPPAGPEALRERVWKQAERVARRRRREGLTKVRARRASPASASGSRPSATANGPRP